MTFQFRRTALWVGLCLALPLGAGNVLAASHSDAGGMGLAQFDVTAAADSLERGEDTAAGPAAATLLDDGAGRVQPANDGLALTFKRFRHHGRIHHPRPRRATHRYHRTRR